MKKQRILVAILVSTGLFSCKTQSSGDKFEISGTITNGNAKMIYLEEMPMGTMQRNVVDSVPIGKDGNYKFKIDKEEATIYSIRLDQNDVPAASVVNDEEKIKLDLTFNKNNNLFADKYEVSGSKGSSQMKDFMYDFNNGLQQIFIIIRRGDSLHAANAPDSVLKAVAMELNIASQKIKSDFMRAVNESVSPAVTMFEVGYYQTTANNPRMSLQGLTDEEVNKVINEAAAKFPDHTRLAMIKKSLDMRTQMAGGQMWVGKIAPEISLPDINGKEVKLSSYKGKYVLVDFWASWCKPCRFENPAVVKAYNKFKDKNFAILGVSLDKSKESWAKAIKDDQLTWTHVSDLKQWESEVVSVYGFGEIGIPYNILLDPDGKVIAERLRGEALEAKLGEVLK